mgnify:CR=1 FL=1
MELFKAIALVLALILLAAFFVAAEIALISLREGQIKQLTGKRGARVASLTQNPNRFLAAAQVGVTVCGFLSAALGAEKLGVFVEPKLVDAGLSEATSRTLSIIIVTLIIAYFSLVLGELVPKRLALFRTEAISLNSSFVIEGIARFFRPIIWLLSKSTDFVVRLLGIDPKEERSQISEEELMELVTGHKALTEEEREIVEEVFNTSEKLVNEVMVPRTEVDFMDGSLTVSKAIELAVELSHSRYPVVRGSSDEVIGFIHVRDLLDKSNANPNSKIQDLARPIMYLPGTKGVLPREPDILDDPKQTFLELAKVASKNIRDDLIKNVNGHLRPGLGYNFQLTRWIKSSWSPERASERSPSLARARKRLREAVKLYVKA